MKPFNLEKALAGEPVKLRDGSKAIVYANIAQYKVEYPLKGVKYIGDNTYDGLEWTLQGGFYPGGTSDNDIIGMWEEPRPTVTLTLPCPLQEPQEEMWFISNTFEVYKSNHSIHNTESLSETWLSQGRYFATEEDAQAWLDAMKNSRR